MCIDSLNNVITLLSFFGGKDIHMGFGLDIIHPFGHLREQIM